MTLFHGWNRHHYLSAGPSALDRSARRRRALTALLAVIAILAAGARIATVRVAQTGVALPRTPAQLLLALERTAAADPHPREAYEGLGAACLRLGHVLSARAAFRRAEALGSDSAWLRQQLAWCALLLDRRAEALHEYRRLLDREPNRPAGYLRLAGAALRMGEPATARAALHAMPHAVREELLAATGPQGHLPLVRYLELLAEAGLPDECLEAARQAVARLPKEVAGHAAAARANLALGRPAEALYWLSEGVRLAPDRAELFALRGDALMALGREGSRDEIAARRDAARAAYERAVALQPSLGPAHYHLGELALSASRWQEAGRAFAAARLLGTEPLASLRGIARATAGAGQSLAATARWAEYEEAAGNTTAARRCYARLAANAGTALAATLALADLDARENRMRDALARLEAARGRQPRSAAVWRYLARAYRRLGRAREAAAAWQQVAILDPAEAHEADRELARMAESLADFDGAERLYEACARLRPDDAEDCRLYGSLLALRRRQGDRLPRAIAQLERAVALDTEDPSGFLALGQVYEAAGRDGEALIAIRHAIDLAPGAGPPYLALGRLARRMGRREEGREMLAMYRLFRQAERRLEGLKAEIAARPHDPNVRLTLAEYYFHARDFSRAAEEYERALAFGGASLSAEVRRGTRARLARAYERLSRHEDAAAQLALAGVSRASAVP